MRTNYIWRQLRGTVGATEPIPLKSVGWPLGSLGLQQFRLYILGLPQTRIKNNE